MKINENIKSSNYAVAKSTRQIEYIILHYTDQDFDTSVEYLTSKEKGVSTHYLIAENGEVYNLVADKYIAFHAGKSYWKGLEALNNNSIGIEIVNSGYKPFTDIQIKSVIELCHYLKKKYDILRENIIGHSDIAPDRKLDPGIYFDWQALNNQGLGIEMPIIPNFAKIQESVFQYDITRLQSRLAKLGYKIEITGKLDKQTSDVIRAFKARFCPEIVFRSHGIEKYRDFDSIYEWDGESERTLEYLLSKQNS